MNSLEKQHHAYRESEVQTVVCQLCSDAGKHQTIESASFPSTRMSPSFDWPLRRGQVEAGRRNNYSRAGAESVVVT